MATQPDNAPKKSNAYEMFIFVLTILSLVGWWRCSCH